MIMSLCGKIGKKYEDMRLNEIPKFVLNLEKRIDRLEHIQKEMSYIGWDYELFKAVDTGCHLGCTLSHVGIIDIAI
jgi:GR25 family glycosyltransferase involved in LPS biosynthesis